MIMMLYDDDDDEHERCSENAGMVLYSSVLYTKKRKTKTNTKPKLEEDKETLDHNKQEKPKKRGNIGISGWRQKSRDNSNEGRDAKQSQGEVGEENMRSVKKIGRAHGICNQT